MISSPRNVAGACVGAAFALLVSTAKADADKDAPATGVDGKPAAPTETAAPPSPSIPSPEPSTSSEPPSAPADGTSPRTNTMRILGLVAGGAGAVEIVVGGVFGFLTLSAVQAQRTDCASSVSCANRAQAVLDHSTAATDATISTGSFIAGGALLVASAVLLLTSAGPKAGPVANLTVLPSVGPGGAGVLLRAEF
jgi:hypothetical protein